MSKRINLSPESDFHRAKRERTKQYIDNEYGWILETCGACSGSGYYDNNGNPPCSACNGTGKTREPGPKSIGRV